MSLTLTIRTVAAVVLAIGAQSAQAELITQSVQPVQIALTAGESEADPADDSDQRIATLESRLAMLESSPTSVGSSSCNRCPIPSTRISTRLNGCATNYAGFEIAALRAYVGGISGSIQPLGLAGNVTSTFDFKVASRFYVGRERGDGLGVRLTYFQFDHTSGASEIGAVTGLDVQSLDLEATSRTKFCGSDILLSGGFRYGKLRQDYTIQNLGSLGFDSEGGGMTIGAQLNRRLGSSRWNLAVGGRASILLTDNSLTIPGVFAVTGEDSTMKVWEMKFGVNRSHQLSCGVRTIFEVNLETQNWDAAPIAGLIGNDISLYGPTVRLGLNY